MTKFDPTLGQFVQSVDTMENGEEIITFSWSAPTFLMQLLIKNFNGRTLHAAAMYEITAVEHQKNCQDYNADKTYWKPITGALFHQKLKEVIKRLPDTDFT